MFAIRPFEKTEADYAALMAVENGVWPDYPVTVEELKHNDATRAPQYLFRRFAVEVKSKIVGTCTYCEPYWAMKPGKYAINIEVLPNCRRRGIGAACYDHLLDAVASHSPTLISASTREDEIDAVHFLTKRGFEQKMRFPTSELDVASFDCAPFAAYPGRMRELGIEIRSLDEIRMTDPDWKRKFYELEKELDRDVPATDPITPMTFETFQERTLGHPGFNAASQFIALDGDHWVGMSGLWVAQAEHEKLYTGLTGVVRTHRRKGIATAMKLRAIAFAQDYGAKIIETDNEEHNPMYQLNLRLGFKPRPAWLEFHKETHEATAHDLSRTDERRV